MNRLRQPIMRPGYSQAEWIRKRGPLMTYLRQERHRASVQRRNWRAALMRLLSRGSRRSRQSQEG
jgi:hypothetical protein